MFPTKVVYSASLLLSWGRAVVRAVVVLNTPNSNSTRIEDLYENQPRLMWLPL